jgi:hypothetical protein
VTSTPATESRLSDDDGVFSGYSERPRPLGEYGLLMATFATTFSVVTAAAARRGRLPERLDARDLALVGIATHKLSRLVTKERVTAVVRAPFTREEDGGDERPRGRGLRRVVGELLTCPFCISQWIAAGFVQGLLFAPRVTRLVAGMMATTALSDFLQIAYRAAEQRRDPA